MKSKKHILSGFLLTIVNFTLAIVPHVIAKPFWVLDTNAFIYVSNFELLYNPILLPILLLVINKKLNKILQFTFYAFNILLMTLSIFISMYFQYLNYAHMTGRFYDPDPGTKWSAVIIIIIGLIIIGIGVAMRYRRLKKNKPELEDQ